MGAVLGIVYRAIAAHLVRKARLTQNTGRTGAGPRFRRVAPPTPAELDARLAGREPTAVSHEAGKVAEAVHGATQKLVHALDRIVGRSREVRGRESIRDE